MGSWTPTPLPLDLQSGLPFTYSPVSISTISNTEVFETGIDKRENQCVVCGKRKKDVSPLQHCHIIPKVENERWKYLRDNGLIPARAKGVAHEARNGVLMCANHHEFFDNYAFYIRWVPSFDMFVFINHSRDDDLEQYHGRAVRLYPNDPRVPFHGAFLDHEVRVRGRWPYLPDYKDRPVNLPIQWQAWIKDVPNSTDGDGHDEDGETKGDMDGGDDEDKEMGDDLSKTIGPEHDFFQSNRHLALSSNTMQSSKPHPMKRPSTKGSVQTKQPKQLMMTFTNPFANPSELEAIMRSSRQQPNWRAAVMEGESWEGTAEENVKKYQRIMNPPPVDWPKVIGNLTGTGGD